MFRLGNTKRNRCTSELNPRTIKAFIVWKNGEIKKYLTIRSKVESNLYIHGSVGSLNIHGKIKNQAFIGGKIGSLTLSQASDIECNLIISGLIKNVTTYGKIQGLLTLQGAIDKSLKIGGETKTIHITPNSNIACDLDIDGNIARDVEIDGVVGGSLVIRGTINRDLNINNLVKGYFALDGEIVGDLDMDWNCRIEGDLEIQGKIGGYLKLACDVKGLCSFQSYSDIKIRSLQAKFHTSTNFNDCVVLSECDFRNFPSFDKCQFSGATLFNQKKTDTKNPFSHEREQRQTIQTDKLSLSEQVSIYRQLRQVYETSGDRPGASDFYFREMEARHELSKQKWSLERGTLSIYKHLSSFGLNPYRAFAWFLIVLIAGSFLFGFGGVTIANTSSQLETEPNPLTGGYYLGLYEVCELGLFTLKSMVSFFSPPEADLSAPEKGIQIFLRFTGPILLAQTILATREKVAR